MSLKKVHIQLGFIFLLLANTLLAGFVYNNNQHVIEHFSAISDGKKVSLSWKANLEKKSDYFTIERSKDGIHFSIALIVKGSGHLHQAIEYSDIDFTPLPGMSYYRIKQTDYEGHAIYSAVVPVNFHFGKNGALIAETAATLDDAEMSKIENKLILVILRDNEGNEHAAKVLVSKQKDQQLYVLDATQTLAKGQYTVVGASFNALYNHKVIAL